MSKNKFYQLKRKKSSLFFLVFCFICMIVAISIPVFAKEEPVKSITIESENLSYEENKPGSYKITKQAEWIGKGKARITFRVDTKELIKENINTDTILIIDTSGSMVGEKLDKVKSDSVDLIQKTLQDNNNKIGIIEFNDNASIVSNLSNDISDLTNKINSLTASGNTNYYQALVKLEELLKTYQKEDNKELAVLFLTDGLPNINTPNEVGQYKYLKSEYTYLNINGIQYEMGNTILEGVKKISDKQFIADMNTLNNVLIDASSPRESYIDFEITDYINTEHFNIENQEAITATPGNFTLDKGTGKTTWNLDNLSSGSSATMTIDVYLKDEYLDKFNLYKTNTKEEVTSEIHNMKENISKTDTPILSNSFTVTYDENTPEGCSVEGEIPAIKDYSTFNPVKIEESNLTCDGYKFQGWEVVNKENVSMIGNDYFVSDGNDIKLRAIWSKVSLKKSMDGTVYEVNSVLKETPFDEENWIPYQGEFWTDKYRETATKIVIQNELKPIENAEESWDVSVASDKSVMAYAVLNEDENTYTIYLQGEGKIIANEDSSHLFYNFSKLQTIEGLEYLDTSKVINMVSMFEECSSLTELDVSNFVTSNVTSMSAMFYGCSSLTELDVSNFDTSKVTDMSFMFYNCANLTNLDLSSFDTSKVESMISMFRSCEKLVNLNINNFNTSKVASMAYMFYNCTNLTNLDLSSFDTSKVTSMTYMFYNCTNLTNLDLSSFDTSKVTSMAYMFSNCTNLTNLDLSSFDTSKVTSMMGMFQSCGNLTSLNLSNFDTSKVMYMSTMFRNCNNLTTIDFRNADFSSVTSYTNMFRDASNLSVIVKDETARSWIQDKLGSNGTAIIAS